MDDSFYVTTPIYYVNAAPHLGHAYTDDRRRRDGAPPPPARRARVLPDRHRRARRARRRRRARARDRAQGARRPQRRALPRALAAAGGEQRFLHPHHRPPARSQGAGGALARARRRLRVRGRVRGLVLPSLRRLQGRQRDRRGQPVPDPPHRAHARARAELLLQAVRLPGAPRSAVRGARGLRHAPHPLQRGAVVHPLGPARRAAHAPQAHLGRARAVGPRARLLRVVRRAAQLLQRPLLRTRGRGSDRDLLARQLPPDRQGHPALPRGVLARAADGRRDRAAAARVHPRLPADGRREDVASRSATCSIPSR